MIIDLKDKHGNENESEKMKTMSLAAILSLPLLLAAGCASNDEPIVFYSAPKIPAFSAAAPAVTSSLSKVDEKKIQTAVYGYMLDRHVWEGGDFSALFLQADDDVVDAMIAKYPHNIPPLKQSSHVDLRLSQSPLDKDTGRPAMILSADVGEPSADGSVAVTGRWFAGARVKGSSSFQMKKSGDEWTIVSVK